jgi:hypothetical protein
MTISDRPELNAVVCVNKVAVVFVTRRPQAAFVLTIGPGGAGVTVTDSASVAVKPGFWMIAVLEKTPSVAATAGTVISTTFPATQLSPRSQEIWLVVPVARQPAWCSSKVDRAQPVSIRRQQALKTAAATADSCQGIYSACCSMSRVLFTIKHKPYRHRQQR